MIRSVLLVSIAVLASGCAAWMHGYTFDEYVHRTLSPDSDDGAYRLELEAKVDLTVRNYLADHGPPDYLRVDSIDTLFLYYLEEDLLAEFNRPWHDINSRVTAHRPIPPDHVLLLPRSAEKALEAERATPTELEVCVRQCLELTDRSSGECFDACRK